MFVIKSVSWPTAPNCLTQVSKSTSGGLRFIHSQKLLLHLVPFISDEESVGNGKSNDIRKVSVSLWMHKNKKTHTNSEIPKLTHGDNKCTTRGQLELLLVCGASWCGYRQMQCSFMLFHW